MLSKLQHDNAIEFIVGLNKAIEEYKAHHPDLEGSMALVHQI